MRKTPHSFLFSIHPRQTPRFRTTPPPSGLAKSKSRIPLAAPSGRRGIAFSRLTLLMGHSSRVEGGKPDAASGAIASRAT